MENPLPQTEKGSNWSIILGYISLSSIIFFIVTILLLHGIQPKLNILYDAISYYVYGRQGWLFTASLILLGTSSIALAIGGLFRLAQGKLATTGFILIGIWGLGLLLASIYPTDPMGSWNKPPSKDGIIHFTAAIYSFISIMLSSIFLAKTLKRNSRWKSVKSIILPITILTIFTFVFLMISILSIFLGDGPPFYFGLTERLHVIAGLCWLSIVSVGFFQK